MNLNRVKAHAVRIQHTMGKPLHVGGRRFQVKGYFANNMATDFRHEPNLLVVLSRLLSERQGVFIDVGVNLGQTLLKVLSIDPERRYIGFEPQVGCCFFVTQFARRNRLANVSVIAAALSSTAGVTTLYSNGDFDEMASIAERADPTGTQHQQMTLVPTYVGDDILSESTSEDIAAIKIDVEGAELTVLQGLSATLAQHQPFVIFEVLPNFFGLDRQMREPDACDRNEARAHAIFGLLSAAGYAIFQIDDQGNELPIHHFNLNNRDGYIGSNYLARPRHG